MQIAYGLGQPLGMDSWDPPNWSKYRTKSKMLPCSLRKNASCIWNVMIKTGPGLAECGICGQEFKSSKGTSNMLRHVKTKHMGDIASYPPNEFSGPSTSGSQPVMQAAGQQSGSSSTSCFDGNIKYRPESGKKRNLDQKLLRMVYRDMQPCSIVDDAGFQDFCKEMDPCYELPSRQQLKQSLGNAFIEEKSRLLAMLSHVDSVAITTELWTSVNMDRFITITAHCLESLPSWELQSVVLATRKLNKYQQGSSSADMADIISKVLDEFNIKEKLVSATTDNTSTMVSVVENHLKVLHVRCFADTINLIVKESIKTSSELGYLVEAVKRIINFFHRSAIATTKLQSAINDLGLPSHKLCQDVEARWNSTLKMLRRYIELHPAVSGSLMALGKTEFIISDQNVEKMKKFCECLEPFEEATEMMSTKGRTSMSKVLVVVRQLHYYLKNEATQCQLTDILVGCLSDRFHNLEESFTGAAATLLDPRFKRVPFSNDECRIQHEEKILSMMRPFFTTDNRSSDDEGRSTGTEAETPPPAKKQKSLMQSFVEKVKEIEETLPRALTGPQAEFQRYMEMKFLDMEEDPLQWWQDHSPLFPHLSIIARKYIFIPGTHVPPNRLFSKIGELVSKKRNCLSESIVDMVLFLNNRMQKSDSDFYMLETMIKTEALE